MSKRAIDRLSHLLKTEHQALLAGDLEVVEVLAEEKAALASKLEAATPSDLKKLTESLDQNGRLLAAAREGVSAVLTTLRQQREARTSLSSYDSSGNATQISPASGTTERRF